MNLANNIEESVDEKTKRLESLTIYLLVNYPDKALEKIKNIVDNGLIKIDINKQILNKLYEESEKGNINIENFIDIFDDENTINYLSGIMSSDFEITDVDKCIEDVIVSYRKEYLLNRRKEILNKLTEAQKLTGEETANLEEELNSIIIKLAKMK